MTKRRGGKGKIPSGGRPRTVGRPGAAPRNTAMADALLEAMASANIRKPSASAASKPRPAVVQANRPAPKQSGVQNRSACAGSGGPARTRPAKAPAAVRRDVSNHTSNDIGPCGAPKPLNDKIAVAPPAPCDNIQRLKAHLSGLADAYEARVRSEAELCIVGES